MDRPTCATCPYWEPGEYNDLSGETDGYCHRLPPSPRLWPIESSEHPQGAMVYNPTMIFESYWCGEHPAMPAYLASRKPD